MKKQGLCPFTYALAGDRVYNPDLKWGVIHAVRFNSSYLTVRFDNGVEQNFTISGAEVKRRYTPEDGQILFWDDQCTTTPMMPKPIHDRNEIVVIEHKIGYGG